MRDAVIVDTVRTPLGKRGGGLSATHPARLSSSVLKALESRVGLDPAVVDDVIWGCATQVAEQAANVARYAVLGAGWPEEVPAVTIDRQCGSSQQALHFAANLIQAGVCDVTIAAGVESMSRVPMGSTVIQGPGSPFPPELLEEYNLVNQGLAAEMIAEQWHIDRDAADPRAGSTWLYDLLSYAVYVAADYSVPVSLPGYSFKLHFTPSSGNKGF